MFITLPAKSSGTRINCRNPARHTSSAPASRQEAKIRRLNSSTDPASLRLTTSARRPARRARSSPKASGLLEITKTIWAASRPSAMWSIRFCSVVPPPESRTAMRIGEASLMDSHIKDATGVVTQQQAGQVDRLALGVDARPHEIVGEDAGQDPSVHVVLGQDELQLVGVAVVTNLLGPG